MHAAEIRTEPPHQAFDIGVKALIVRSNHILVLKRRDLPRWEVPGGRINEGEGALDTLRRELSEELPHIRRVRIGRIVHAEHTDFTLPNGNRLMLLFYRVTAELPLAPAVSDEHAEAAWVSLAELSNLDALAPVREAARIALRRNRQ